MLNIYVKNVPLTASADELRRYFEAYGKVVSAEIVTNVRTGEPKDYAFVVMGSEEEGNAAIEALNGKEWLGKALLLERGRNRKRKKLPPGMR